jgi:hypothetical protein
MPWSDEQKIDVVVKTMMRLIGRMTGSYIGPILAPLTDKDQQVLSRIKDKDRVIWQTYYEHAAAIIAALEREPP